jgi:hypothetical protein
VTPRSKFLNNRGRKGKLVSIAAGYGEIGHRRHEEYQAGHRQQEYAQAALILPSFIRFTVELILRVGSCRELDICRNLVHEVLAINCSEIIPKLDQFLSISAPGMGVI